MKLLVKIAIVILMMLLIALYITTTHYQAKGADKRNAWIKVINRPVLHKASHVCSIHSMEDSRCALGYQPPLFLSSPPLSLLAVQSHLFRQFPHIYWFFANPHPPENFSVNPHNIKIFHP